jgi:hypothetical protein
MLTICPVNEQAAVRATVSSGLNRSRKRGVAIVGKARPVMPDTQLATKMPAMSHMLLNMM